MRRDGLNASRGAVDLGEYFLYFSFFLIVAAVLLSASFFRLGVEQRVREVGTLRAVGYSTSRIRRVFLDLLAQVGHVHVDQPGLVVDAIREVVEAARG